MAIEHPSPQEAMNHTPDQRLQDSPVWRNYELFPAHLKNIIFRIRIKPELATEYISQAITEISGYSPEDFYTNPHLYCQMIHPASLDTLQEIKAGRDDFSAPLEMQWVAKDGHIFWTEQLVTVFDERNSESLIIEGLSRDITKRILYEEHLKEIAYHDELTGLYNRAYLGREIRQLVAHNLTWGLILCDIDFLKFTNDAFGHQFGDELIITAANYLKEALAQYPLIGRVGGDEFAIIIPECSEEQMNQIVSKISSTLSPLRLGPPDFPLNFSMGFSICTAGKTIDTTYQEAENAMYLDKLKRTQRIRDELINRFFEILQRRRVFDETHGRRSQYFSMAVGKYLGLDPTRLQFLSLASQFNDLGKVRIPPDILAQPNKLKPEDMKVVQTHSEFGYRIALSLPFLAPVADLILKHHEAWDGSGYPLGICGEDIPIECRINLVTDAYVAMTSDRPYRKALTHREALAELVRCSGKQFDPTVVDAFLEVFGNLDS